MQNESGLVKIDSWLAPYNDALNYRVEATDKIRQSVTGGKALVDCFDDFNFFCLHKNEQGNWTFREWAPAATTIYFLCEANNWQDTPEYAMDQEIHLPIQPQYSGKYEVAINTATGEIFQEGEGISIESDKFAIKALSSVILRRKQNN